MKMKTLLIIIGIIALLVAMVGGILSHPAFGRRLSRERKERILASPNYRNGAFQNELPTPQFTGENGTRGALWKFLFTRDNNRVPSQPLPAVKTNLQKLDTATDQFIWFGHSSYLFVLDGMTFLIDPVLNPEFPSSLMLHPFKGTDIYHAEDMPSIDYLIITHEHWDHLDYATLRRIRNKVQHVVCPLGVGEYLDYWGYPAEQITEMDWYEHSPITTHHSPITTHHSLITCLPSRHFSNRLFAANQTLWASFMVEANGRKVYIGGDGGYDDRFSRIHEQFGEVDLAILENGQYNANWRYIHTMPEDLERAIMDLQPKHVFTVHHDRFSLSTHAWNEPNSIAHSIAEKCHISLLDSPIGTIVQY